MTNNLIRIPLEGAFNVRELGGYPVSGGATSFHKFLRADDLGRLTERDIQTLLDYGVIAVIDLRSGAELRNLPNPFATLETVEYVNLPLMSDAAAAPDLTRVMADVPEDYLKQAYIEMLVNSQMVIAEIFRFIARHPDGCVLFHCAAGKDRTGVIAALLLGLAGVARADILANYSLTHTYLRENRAMMDVSEQFPRALMYSLIEYMEPALDLIEKQYDGFAHYLSAIGVSEDEMQVIKRKLVYAG